MNAEMFFAIGKHNFTVVGMDGAYIKPVVSSFVMIAPGQTMDILVTADQSLGQYYMATRQYDSVKPDVTDYDKVNATAILQYTGNYTDTSGPYFPDTLPIYYDYKSAINFMSLIRSLANEEYPIEVPRNITNFMYITASMGEVEFVKGSDTRTALASSLNNVSWVNPSTDVLMAYYRYSSSIHLFILLMSLFNL